MIKVNVFEAKARLSEYLDRVTRGERVIVCRHNKPVAELRAVENTRTEPRPIGPLAGRPRFDVPESFFEPLSAEELDMWDGAAPTDPVTPASRLRRAGRSARLVEARNARRTNAPRRRRRRS